MLLKEAESRGIALRMIGDTDIIEAKLGEQTEYFINYTTRLTPAVYLSIFKDKYYSKMFLQDKGISVTPGCVFAPTQEWDALEYAMQMGFPVVIKPVNGSQGHFVFANLKDENEFSNAFKVIAKQFSSRCILVEKYFEGDDYRFLIIANKDIAVVKRSAPKITGDGVSSIRELVNKENDRRMNPRATCLCTIKIDDEESTRTLQGQGLTTSSIPSSGQMVVLRNNSNVSGGGSCDNVLETVDETWFDLARRIHALFPGNTFTCIDLLSKDVTVPVTHDGYAFCEFNSDPGFSLHEMPGTGKPHSVVKSMIDLLFPNSNSIDQRLVI